MEHTQPQVQHKVYAQQAKLDAQARAAAPNAVDVGRGRDAKTVY